MTANNLFDELSRLAAVAGKCIVTGLHLETIGSPPPILLPCGYLRLLLSPPGCVNSKTMPRKARVLEIGRITGLREEAGRYYPANFERGLLLREIVRRHRPQRILELGTGRGLGILCIADQVRALDYRAELVSVDIIPPQSRQHWPILPGRGIQQPIPFG